MNFYHLYYYFIFFFSLTCSLILNFFKYFVSFFFLPFTFIIYVDIVFVKQEFERAIELNSGLLTNMAIRFIKICGFYDPNSFKWWNFMKQHFKEKYIVSSINKLSLFIIFPICCNF